MISMLLVIVLCYLIGSIPFGYIIVKIVKHADIREVGSKSIGATNVQRTAGNIPAIVVLILDAAKGYIAVLLVGFFPQTANPDIVKIIATIAVIAGHSWPLFLNFRGGKGVATGLGAFLRIALFPTLISLVVFIVIVVITRYVSLGSIVGALILPLSFLIFGKSPTFIMFTALVALMIVIRHRDNIRRLIAGTENKIGNKKNG